MGHPSAFRRAQEARLRQAAEGQFAKQVAAGAPSAMPIDRFGVPIRVGDEILFRPPFDWVFHVVAIQPIMDPRAPVGMVTMVLQASAPVHVQGGQPLMNATIVMSAEVKADAVAAESAHPDAEMPSSPIVDPAAPEPTDPAEIVTQ